MNCLICGRELEFKRGKGWIHRETDSTYMMKCKDCGYEGEQVNDLTCPACGGKNYVDDHCVSPSLSENSQK